MIYYNFEATLLYMCLFGLISHYIEDSDNMTFLYPILFYTPSQERGHSYPFAATILKSLPRKQVNVEIEN